MYTDLAIAKRNIHVHNRNIDRFEDALTHPGDKDHIIITITDISKITRLMFPRSEADKTYLKFVKEMADREAHNMHRGTFIAGLGHYLGTLGNDQERGVRLLNEAIQRGTTRALYLEMLSNIQGAQINFSNQK